MRPRTQLLNITSCRTRRTPHRVVVASAGGCGYRRWVSWWCVSRSGSRRCRGPRPRCLPSPRCIARPVGPGRRRLRSVGCSWWPPAGRHPAGGGRGCRQPHPGDRGGIDGHHGLGLAHHPAAVLSLNVIQFGNRKLFSNCSASNLVDRLGLCRVRAFDTRDSIARNSRPIRIASAPCRVMRPMRRHNTRAGFRTT